MDILRNSFQYLIDTVTFVKNSFVFILENYGWHLLFGIILFYYIFIQFIRPLLTSIFGSYKSFKKRQQQQEYDAKYHKNPDLFSSRISAQQGYTQKLQEKYDQQAKEYQAKITEKENKKRQEIINLLRKADQGGYRLGGSSTDENDKKTSKSLKPEYNPLMGPGSSSNYRPPKKTRCGGGGCG